MTRKPKTKALPSGGGSFVRQANGKLRKAAGTAAAQAESQTGTTAENTSETADETAVNTTVED